MSQKIILFDGVCNLCNGAIQFVIKHDRKSVFKFAAIQTEEGKKLLQKFNIDPAKTDSLILIANDKAYIKSSAALRIARELDHLLPLLYIFILIPGFIRHGIYDLIAKNRYNWFGKRESCMMPTEELNSRFL
tara:strand:- start:57 stop:452 length:396 start_codon:yes stop_codon:yes gene_type:complete